MKRIVLFVEGDGETKAAPKLIGRLLNEHGAFDVVYLDNNTFRVGHVNKLVKEDYREWRRWLAAAAKRDELGGVILLLDGDIRRVRGEQFCAATVAQGLATAAGKAGAGQLFSVAVVFACQEFESWLIAGIGSLAGKRFPDGRTGVVLTATAPDSDLEVTPNDAKGWIDRVMVGGYKPTRDQVILAQMVDLQMVRDRNMRSFRRLESALNEIVSAIRSEAHVASPSARDRDEN